MQHMQTAVRYRVEGDRAHFRVEMANRPTLEHLANGPDVSGVSFDLTHVDETLPERAGTSHPLSADRAAHAS
jgi:hypothetical protein